MEEGPSFGVLCALTGGYFFGAVLAGAARAASAVGGRVVAVQTSDAGLDVISLNKPSDLSLPMAWRRVSGFAVILNTVTPEYLESIRATGKPVVMICDEAPGFASPVVMADGRPGVRQAVEHLLAHGHRRIAFAGCLHPKDVQQRYETYRATLRAHGVEPDPALLYEVGNNEEPSGDHAARQMLAAGLPSTAVITGSDANAIGLMNRLRAAGLRLPEDQAVIGFDDMVGVGCLSPGLSSVYQPFDALGERAIELIMRSLRGEAVASAPHWVNTSFVVRESCGCPPGRSVHHTVAGAGTPPEQRLARALASSRASDDRPDAAAAEVLARGAAAVAAVLGTRPAAVAGDLYGPTELDQVLADVYRLDPRPETLVEIAAQLRAYADEYLGTGDGPPGVDVEQQLWQVLLGLVRVQARIAYVDSGQYQGDASVRYEVSMDLLRSHEEDPRALRWLRRTGWRGGCLGLWRSSPAGPRVLEIVGMYDQLDPDGPPTPARSVAPDAFPPAELLAMVRPGSGDMVSVIPVRLDTADWGMLALVAPPDTMVRTGREMTNQCAALLTVALNHEAVLRALHEQESLLRRASLHDPLTDLPNRAQFLDHLGQALALTRRDPTRQFAVLFLDLDRFKSVNDTLGHFAGDQVLVEVAARLRQSLRESDVGARFGGDEFAILMDVGRDRQGAVTLADRLHDVMAVPFELDGGQIQISVSIGIAQGLDRYRDAKEVLRDADVAMYTAKKNGSHISAARPAPTPTSYQ